MASGPIAALLLQSALVVLAALVARRMPLTAVALGAAAFLGVPWLAGPVPAFRGLITLFGGVSFMRVIDLARTKDAWSAARRVLHVTSVVDTRTFRRVPPRLELRAIGRGIFWGALAAAGFVVSGDARDLLRAAGGLVFVYSAIAAAYAVFETAFRLGGVLTPPLHVSPIASVSVAELWGARWARPISAWLRDTCFNPLARRGRPRWGLFLAFVASALGHAYPVLVALDASMAAAMLAFFVVQGVFVIAESVIRTARWPRWARRALTIVLMVGSSPLFVEPALRVLGRAPLP